MSAKYLRAEGFFYLFYCMFLTVQFWNDATVRHVLFSIW